MGSHPALSVFSPPLLPLHPVAKLVAQYIIEMGCSGMTNASGIAGGTALSVEDVCFGLGALSTSDEFQVVWLDGRGTVDLRRTL